MTGRRRSTLGRGDLPPFMRVFELFTLTFYAGTGVLAVAYLRDRGAPPAVGALLLLGLVGSSVVPGALTVLFLLLAVVVLRTGLDRSDPADDRQRAATGH